VFSQTIQAGYLALVIVAVVNSIICWLLLQVDFSDVHQAKRRTKRTPVIIYAVAIVAIVLNIALGLFPSLVLDLLA
jgi:NADH-quinone oxidoreductase subunit N